MGIAPSRALPDPAQWASRATQTEWDCPVCQRVCCDSLAVPCGHAFCLGCLLRAAAADPACPRCRSPVIAARFSVLGDADFLQCILSPPGRSPGARRAQFRLVETCPRPRCPRSAPAPAEPPGPLPPELWAELLHGQEHLLDPVRPWLRHSLEAIHGPRWWEAREVESIALSALCIYGPDRDALAQMLQSYLGEYTAPLVHGLVHATLSQCGEAWRLQRSPPARDRAGSSASSSSCSSSPLGTPTASPGGTPTHSQGGTPTHSPGGTPTHSPGGTPTHSPRGTPTHSPRGTPTHSPGGTPTHSPGGTPTHSPGGTPTHSPGGTPTHSPRGTPTHSPGGTPTHSPRGTPTHSPGGTPTHSPRGTPTHSPRGTPRPSQADACDPAGLGLEEQLSTPEAPPGSPGQPQSVPVPAEQEQPQDTAQEPGEAPGPSTPVQDRGHNRRQHRHPRKRRGPHRHSSSQPRRRKKRRK